MASKWHHWELERIFDVLQSSPSGITYAIARKRLRQGKKNPLVFFLLFFIILVVLLLVPSTRSVLLSKTSFLVIITLIFQGAVYRSFLLAKRRWQKLDPNLQKTIVRRDDRYMVIPSRSLAEGDIVRIQPGDWIEVDIRLVVLKDLIIAREENQSWQVQIKDTTAPLPLDVPRSEHGNMVYSNSLVVSGEAMGVVVSNYRRRSLSRTPFPGLSVLITIWFIYSAVFLFISFTSVSLSTVYLLLVSSIPCHWWNLFEVCLLQGVESLKERGIVLRSFILLWHLSRVDKIVVDINNYNVSDLIDLDVNVVGLSHSAEEDLASLSVPVISFIPGLALPSAHCLALVTDTKEDDSLFAKVPITITSANADPVLQRESGVVLPTNDFKLVLELIKVGRQRIDRVKRILHFSLCSGLALLSLLALSSITRQISITPLQMVWSGVFLPTTISLLFLLEPEPEDNLPSCRHLFDKRWVRNLLANFFMMTIPTIVVFRSSGISLAWTVFNFSIVSLGSSLVRVPLTKFYEWLWGMVGVVVIQVVWVQTARSGMKPLNLWNWIVAIVIASGMFWLNELLASFDCLTFQQLWKKMKRPTEE